MFVAQYFFVKNHHFYLFFIIQSRKVKPPHSIYIVWLINNDRDHIVYSKRIQHLLVLPIHRRLCEMPCIASHHPFDFEIRHVPHSCLISLNLRSVGGEGGGCKREILNLRLTKELFLMLTNITDDGSKNENACEEISNNKQIFRLIFRRWSLTNRC